jgi:hypothetical protein
MMRAGATIERAGHGCHLVAPLFRCAGLEVALAQSFRGVLHVLETPTDRTEHHESNERHADSQHATAHETHGGPELAGDAQKGRTSWKYDDLANDRVAHDDRRQAAALSSRATLPVARDTVAGLRTVLEP